MKSAPDGDIDFYEELGVEPHASADTVRETYRSLVRLLHPDQQTDPQLKAIAEAQMRKLNRIYGVLSDPEKRQRYDQVLLGTQEPPTLVISNESAARVRQWMTRIGWGSVSVAALAGIIWVSSGAGRDPSDDTPALSQKRGAIARSTGSTASDQTDEVQQLRGELHAMETERNRALEELARLRGGKSVPPAPTAPTNSSIAGASGRNANGGPVEPGALAATSLPRSNFGGEWYWTRSMQPASELRGSYQPDSIEVTLVEKNGVIRGNFHAKYRVPDSTINPNVSFEFAATLAGPILICPWTGPGGARGQVMVRQTSADSLQIDWTATDLGMIQRVSTGSAVLARRVQ
jgi:hypothetical protein